RAPGRRGAAAAARLGGCRAGSANLTPASGSSVVWAAVGGFLLSTEHEDLRSALRRFAEDLVAPHAAEAGERAEFPWKSFEAYRDSGFVRLPYPVEYGGDGGDMVAYALLVEEVARVCASSSLFVLISRLACEPVLRYGTDELKARVVTKVAAGDWQ